MPSTARPPESACTLAIAEAVTAACRVTGFVTPVPSPIRSVLRGRRPVVRSDGHYVRDYFYVEDAAAAYLLLAERLAEEQSLRGEAFNFSYERPMTVLELVSLILRLMKSDLEPDVRSEATGEIRNQYLTAEEARRVLGWKPLFRLEEGLTRTIEWYEALAARQG